MKNIRDKFAVASEVEKVADGYFGSGCLPHSCTFDEGSFFISNDGKTAVIAILYKGSFDSEPSFQLFGSSYVDLPKAMMAWGEARGMNERNSARY